MMAEYDVVIIGAGFSGLVAAYTILKEMPSAKIVVLESSDHIGGPIVCREMKTANGTGVFDLGAARIGTEHKEMLQFVKELGLETYPQFRTGDKFWQMADGTMKQFSGNIPPLPYTSLIDLMRYFKKVDSLSSEVNLENPAASEHAAEWDTTSVEEFRKSILWTEVASQTVDTLTGSVFKMNISELKLMQYLYVIRSDGGWDNHSDKESSRKLNLKIKGGFEKVCTELVQKISEPSILKNETVTRVEQDDRETKAVVKTSSGKDFAAKRVICAVAINHIGGITFEPSLRVDRTAAFPKGYPVVNCVLTYSTPFWREDGHVGQVLSMCGNLSFLAQNDDHPVMGVADHHNSESCPALMAVLCAPGLQKKTAEERKDVLLKYLKDIFSDKVMEPLDYQELIWDTQYRGPAPRNDVKPSEALSALRTPHGRVHWAGSYTATAWANSLAGALQAGQRAANEVVAALI